MLSRTPRPNERAGEDRARRRAAARGPIVPRLAVLALALVPILAPAVAQSTLRTPGVRPLDAACDAERLAILERDVGDARVVALGESAPGSATIAEAKACIARFLVDRMGFDVVAFEAAHETAENLTEADDPRRALRGLFPLDSEEILAFVEWVRERNEGDDAVAFAGFEVAAGPATIRDVLGFLADVDAAYVPTARAAYAGLLRYYENPDGLETDRAEAWLLDARAVVEHLEANRGAYLDRVPRARVHRVLHQARLVPRMLELFRSGSRGSRMRDGFLAENLLSLLEARPDSRFVVWTHNQRAREADPLVPSVAPPTMGERLVEELGEDHYAIAFTFGAGEVRVLERADGAPGNARFATGAPMAGSLEAALASRGDVLVLLDDVRDEALAELFAEPRAMRRLHAYAGEDAYAFYDLPAAFDALVHLERSEPATPIDAP